MDETFDYVVVGSGGGSLCAALVMRAAGKRVLVLE
ncbi:FAD-binding protein, partial [Mangrovimicrobium sediminis]